MKRSLFLLFFLVAAVLLFAACKKENSAPPSSNPGTPPANEVFMQNSMFSPTTLNISVNTTVKWTNKDGIAHTVTSNSGEFDSGSISAGGTFSHTFSVAGSYPYFCAFHSGMTGTIIVR